MVPRVHQLHDLLPMRDWELHGLHNNKCIKASHPRKTPYSRRPRLSVPISEPTPYLVALPT